MSEGNGSGKDREHGFQFPGEFEITAVGPANAELEAVVPELLSALGLEVLPETVRTRNSREGRYVAVSVSFACSSREDYEAAHRVLRTHEHVRYTH